MDNTDSADGHIVGEIRTLLWGNCPKEDVFRRWAQGFQFSQDEPTALVQIEGGPCAVIAPVQAFIIKELLLEGSPDTWKNITTEKQDRLLIRAAMEIIGRAGGDGDSVGGRYALFYMEVDEVQSQMANGETEEEELVEQQQQQINSDYFHRRLRISPVATLDELEKQLTQRIETLKETFGVLLLLYSIVYTKGINNMRSDMSDEAQPIIDSVYGYGSQSLINLMLTGRAVSHVWDDDQNIGGLTLKGINKQNTIGFLALLEHLRYCEVGSYLKSPFHPVWVIGSETHLTVLFSADRRLVSLETPAERARRVFKKYDPEGNNFIPENLLQDVLAELGLVADDEYVDIMRKKLDNESLGIILLASFMDEFYPEEQRTCPDTFTLYHYNGLPRSNPDNRLRYHIGEAVLLECTVKCILESNAMLTVLQTKWPSIEVQWDIGRSPSLN